MVYHSILLCCIKIKITTVFDILTTTRHSMIVETLGINMLIIMIIIVIIIIVSYHSKSKGVKPRT